MRKYKVFFISLLFIAVILVLLSWLLPVEHTVFLAADDTVKLGTESLEYRLVNLSLHTIYYGADDWVEKLDDGQWKRVEMTVDLRYEMWLGISSQLNRKTRQNMACCLAAYNIDEPGRYRISKHIEVDEDKENHIIYSEFTVTE